MYISNINIRIALTLAVVVGTLCVSNAATITAIGQTREVSGRVVTEDRNGTLTPVSNLTVFLSRMSIKLHLISITDSNGNFKFTSVPILQAGQVYALSIKNDQWRYQEPTTYEIDTETKNPIVVLKKHDFSSLYYTCGQFDKDFRRNEGIDCLNAALKLKPGDTNAVKELASVHARRSRERSGRSEHTAAIADLEKAISLNPAVAWYWSARGESYFAMGEKEKAQLDFKKASSIDPEDELAIKGLNALVTGKRIAGKELPKTLAGTDWTSSWGPDNETLQISFEGDGRRMTMVISDGWVRRFLSGKYKEVGAKFTIEIDRVRRRADPNSDTEKDDTEISGEYYISPEGRVAMRLTSIKTTKLSEKYLKAGQIFTEDLSSTN